MIIMKVLKFKIKKKTYLVCAQTIYSSCFRDHDCEEHFEHGERMRGANCEAFEAKRNNNHDN